MKKAPMLLFLAMILIPLLGAQETSRLASGYYSFEYPQSFTGIEETAAAFAKIRESFNEVFCFEDAPDTHPSRVVILKDKAAFDAYVSAKIGETRNQYIFLKYSKPELSELVLYPGNASSGYAAFAGPALNRQLFLQFLYSNVSEPPVWIRDGFQAYFETLSYNTADGLVSTGSYSPWLETAKNLNADPERKLDASAVIGAVTGSYESSRYYPQAWSFVMFLLSTENAGYQRFLHESFVLLRGSNPYNGETQQQNTDLIRNRFLRFHTAAGADADFSVWISGQYTYNELLQSGISLYGSGDYAGAEKSLKQALVIRPEDPMLIYYLGLVSYAKKDYAGADEWYRTALKYGADGATVNWALGLNAYADKRFTESKVYLETAKAANRVRYGEKADQLISSMPK